VGSVDITKTNIFSFWSPSELYPVIDHGEGIYLFDIKGKRYIDGASVPMCVSIGHGSQRVLKAMENQARKVTFVSPWFFVTEPALKLAEKLSNLTPGSLNKVLFVSGGSEGVEVAIKLAYQYHAEKGNRGKSIVIGRWQSYHGATLGALSVTGVPARRRSFIPLLQPYPHIAPAYCYRCMFGKQYPGCDIDCALELERAVRQVGPEYVSAFIAEPVVAPLGASYPPKEYFRIIRETCNKYDMLFIDDEVITGFGRTGEVFAINHWGVEPDIMVLSKSMGSGYSPLGATVVRDEIYETIRKGSGAFIHTYTYSGNPLSCAVGLAVLDILSEDNLVSQSRQMGDILLKKLKNLDHPTIGDVRGLGLFTGIEFVKDRRTKEPFPSEYHFSKKVFMKAFENGLVLIYRSGCVDGVLGDHVLIGPPLIVTPAQIDEIVDILDASLKEVEKA